jgi:tRNA(fMet)-specific endonuclease VapC
MRRRNVSFRHRPSLDPPAENRTGIQQSVDGDAAIPGSDFHLSIVSFHEQVLGWNAYLQKATKPDGIIRGYSMFEALLDDFNSFQLLPFDLPAMQHFTALRAAQVRIATMDLRIAAIALSRGFTLLSRNLVDFEKVPGLVVEDWTVP